MQIIGIRHVEKLHVTALLEEVFLDLEDLGGYFRMAQEVRGKNHEKYLEIGGNRLTEVNEYSSFNTHQLDTVGSTRKMESMDALAIES